MDWINKLLATHRGNLVVIGIEDLVGLWVSWSLGFAGFGVFWRVVDRLCPERGGALSEARRRFVSSLAWCVLKFGVEPRQDSLRASRRWGHTWSIAYCTRPTITYVQKLYNTYYKRKVYKRIDFELLDENLLKVPIDFTKTIRPSNIHKCAHIVKGKELQVTPPANQ